MERRRARCAPYGKGRASGNVRRACLVARSDMSVCRGARGAKPRADLNGEKARTMRALRERPCQRQRQARMPGGAERHVGLPRGMGARSPELTSMERRRARCAPYGKGSASGNVRRACLVARRDVAFCNEDGGAKPRADLNGEKARTMRALRERLCQRQRQTHAPGGAERRGVLQRGWGREGPELTSMERRRARCAPYGKGSASGNVRRTRLVARRDMSVCRGGWGREAPS